MLYILDSLKFISEYSTLYWGLFFKKGIRKPLGHFLIFGGDLGQRIKAGYFGMNDEM